MRVESEPRLTLADLEGRATITVAEAASLLGIGLRQAYEAAARGSIPAIRIGERRILIPVAALLALLGGGDAPKEGVRGAQP